MIRFIRLVRNADSGHAAAESKDADLLISRRDAGYESAYTICRNIKEEKR